MNKADIHTDYARKPDEISIRNLILKIGEFIRLIIGRWYLLVLGALPLAYKQYASAKLVQPTYPASTTLLIKPQDIAKENKSLILVFSRLANSKELIKEILLERDDTLGVGELIINRYLEAYFQYDTLGLSPEIPRGFRFTHDDPASFSPEETQVFKIVVEKVTSPGLSRNGYLNVSVDEALGLITLSTSTPSEELTFLLLRRLREKVERLFYENTLFAQKKAFREIFHEADSLAEGYRKAYYALNKTRDRYERLLRTLRDSNDAKVLYLHDKIIRLEVHAELYKLDYLASLEQMKAAGIDLNSKTPLITVIEESLPPLTPVRPSPTGAAVKGAILGVVLVILFIVVRKIYSDIMDEVKDPYGIG
ncbi:MAG: hypothetical protein D6765_14445 [Bacteroidetes bacterium]|nr:MAG: hypothetical protein D6765_14445 [Bacteroidota bacterium]